MMNEPGSGRRGAAALQRLRTKKRKLVVGLMSGTSADGIDAALVEVRGAGSATAFRTIAFRAVPYPRGFRSFLLKNSSVRTARIDDIARLNSLVGMLFAEAASAVVRQAGFRLADVDLIGSHGQTIHHLPRARRMFGRTVRATLQIGDPAFIATQTGIVTVGDFRPADIAAGGTGAPLVPYVDWLLYRSSRFHRGLLNIGGIANLTVLPRRCRLQDVRAFDTGPGNMIVDGLMRRLLRRPFDRDGAVAKRGTIAPALLSFLMRHPFVRRRPPKSTGREEFGDVCVDSILRMGRHLPPADLVATAAEFTARSIANACLKHVPPRVRLDEIAVSGGGVRNPVLMDSLSRLLPGVRIRALEEIGGSAAAKEAIAFALLANETVAGHPSSVPGATGARRPALLGKISFP